jgi:hypothetical protein
VERKAQRVGVGGIGPLLGAMGQRYRQRERKIDTKRKRQRRREKKRQ